MLFGRIALLDPDGDWSQVTPQRDVLDRVWRVNRPAAIGADLDTIPSTTTQFDSLDRVLIATSPNGAKVTAGHSMFGTTTVDSLAREREEIRDVDGITIETIERVDISPPLALPWDRTYDYLHTFYAHGPFGLLKTLTDSRRLDA